MLRVKLDREDPAELHEQVAAQIRRAIADGEAGPGERLPPARDLAAVLGVNRNTVLRALRQLRDEEIVDFRRGRGVTVTGRPERAALVAHARALVELGRKHGYHARELAELVTAVAQREGASTK
jgi:GntR family transcriptional regulator